MNTPDAANTPIEVYGDSPDRVDIPTWLIACFKLAPPQGRTGEPRRNVDGLRDVAWMLLAQRMGTRPDEAITLNREAIGRWAGTRPDRASWITDYLASVGFLDVYRRWTQGGRRADVFALHVRPPTEYVGPQTAAELDEALRDPDNPPTLFSPGHTQNPTGRGMGTSAKPDRAGYGDVSPGHTQNPTGRGMPRTRGIEIEGEPLTGVPPEMNANAGTPAGEPAAGDPLEERPDLADLVAHLPWPGDSLSLSEARDVVSAMCQAEQQLGWTADRLVSEATNALTYRKGNPARFVAQRFRQGDRHGRFRLAPKSERGDSGVSSSTADEHHDVEEGEAEEPQAGEVDRVTGEHLPTWCGVCNDGVATARRDKSLRMTDAASRCSACHPDYDPQQPAPQKPRPEDIPQPSFRRRRAS